MARPPIVAPWTPEQDEMLRQLAARNVSLIKAAVALGRRMSAVQVRARKLGVSFPGVREVRRKLRNLENFPASGRTASE